MHAESVRGVLSIASLRFFLVEGNSVSHCLMCILSVENCLYPIILIMFMKLDSSSKKSDHKDLRRSTRHAFFIHGVRK